MEKIKNMNGWMRLWVFLSTTWAVVVVGFGVRGLALECIRLEDVWLFVLYFVLSLIIPPIIILLLGYGVAWGLKVSHKK